MHRFGAGNFRTGGKVEEEEETVIISASRLDLGERCDKKEVLVALPIFHPCILAYVLSEKLDHISKLHEKMSNLCDVGIVRREETGEQN